MLVEQVSGVQPEVAHDRLEPLEAAIERAVDQAVDLVALLQEKLSEVGAVLTADAGDQSALHTLIL